MEWRTAVVAVYFSESNEQNSAVNTLRLTYDDRNILFSDEIVGYISNFFGPSMTTTSSSLLDQVRVYQIIKIH